MRWLLLVVVSLGGWAWSQVCLGELSNTFQNSSSPEHVSGIEGAALLRLAVDLIEPGLPALAPAGDLPLEAGSPGYDDALYLQRRRLLPTAWQPGQLTTPVWQEMVREFMAWYRLDPVVVRAPQSEAVVLEDLALVLARVAAAVRPLALLASDPDDRQRISFLGVIWNWTVYPRLLVVRPAAELSLAQGVAPVLVTLDTCALRFRRYILAPEPTARRLFLANVEARMVVVGAQPSDAAALPRLIEAGRELEVLAFAHPLVADLELFAAVFAGPQASPVGLLRLLPQVRTNLSPQAFLRHLQTP